MWPHRGVVQGDPGAAEHGAGRPSDVEGDPDVGELAEAHLRRRRARPASLSRPSWTATSCGLVDRRRTISASLRWVSWKPRDRPAELRALEAVGQRLEVAGARRAHRTPDDPEAGLVEARQRALEAADLGEARRRRAAGRRRRTSSAVTEARSDSLRLDLGGGEAGGVGRDDEAPDRRPRSGGPDHRDVGDGAVGDPHLARR